MEIQIMNIFQRTSYKPGDLIYIEWEDAVASDGGWRTPEQVERWFDDINMLVKEVGWVHSKTEKYLGLYSRVSCWSDDDNELGMLQKIPLTWVRKIEVLKKGGVKNEKKVK